MPAFPPCMVARQPSIYNVHWDSQMRLVWTKSSSSILHTTTSNERQREERSGAETTNKLALREVVAASSGSNVTPVEKVGEEGGYTRCTCHPCSLKGEAKWGLFSFSSVLYWPHCSSVEAVVRGRARMGLEGGGAGCIPPSGIAIILQTECHALQTADKKTVTTVGWWRREREKWDRKEKKKKQHDGQGTKKEIRRKREKQSRRHPEKKRQVHIDSPAPSFVFLQSSLLPPLPDLPLLLLPILPPCSFPPSLAAPMWGMQDACLRLQMSGPHNANLISLAVWVATLPRKERKGEERRRKKRTGEEENK